MDDEHPTDKELPAVIAMIFVIAALALTSIAAWVTHVVWWVNLYMNEQLDTAGEGVLAVLGTLCPPIGVIHGVILWF